jgi:hypothetical protein
VLWRSLFTPATLYLREIGGWALPLRGYFRSALLSGRLPEWMPHMQLGLPFAADPSNGVFYPPGLLLALPWPQALDVFVFLHVAIAALGAAALARRLGAGTPAAVAAGLTFSLSGYVLSMTSSLVYLVGPSWAPLVLWAALWRASASRRVPCLAGLLAFQVLGGDPQAALLSSFVALALVAAGARDRRDTLARAGAILAGGALALGVAAVQVLPAALLARESVRRAGVPLDIAQMFSLHPLRLIELCAPGATGDTPPESAYLGRALLDARHTWPFAFSIYLGAAALVLGPRGARGRVGGTLVAIFCASLLIALGRHAGLYAVLWRFLPAWSIFRYPEKIVAWATLCAAMLVGLGAERLGQDPPRARARPAWFAAPALLCGAAVVLLAARFVPGGHALAVRIAERLALSAGGVALLGLILLRGGDLASVLVPLFIALDLGFHGARLVDAAVPSARPLPLEIAAGRTLAYPPRGFCTAAAKARVERAPTTREMERIAARLALPDREVGALQHLEGHTAAQPESGELLLHALHGHGKRMLDLLDVEWVLQTGDDPKNPALDPVATEVGVTLARNRDAQPRARLYFYTAAAPDDATALRWVADPRFPADAVALVEPDGPALRSMRPPLPCDVVRYRPEAVELRCVAPEPALLVLAEQHAAGWDVAVDGRPARLLRADVALRAVALGPGTHTVRFSYRTPGLLAGAATSAGFLLLCAALLLRSRRR